MQETHAHAYAQPHRRADTLPMLKAFEAGGFPREKAEAAAVAIRENVTAEIKTAVVSEQQVRKIVEEVVEKSAAGLRAEFHEALAAHSEKIHEALAAQSKGFYEAMAAQSEKHSELMRAQNKTFIGWMFGAATLLSGTFVGSAAVVVQIFS